MLTTLVGVGPFTVPPFKEKLQEVPQELKSDVFERKSLPVEELEEMDVPITV